MQALEWWDRAAFYLMKIRSEPLELIKLWRTADSLSQTLLRHTAGSAPVVPGRNGNQVQEDGDPSVSSSPKFLTAVHLQRCSCSISLVCMHLESSGKEPVEQIVEIFKPNIVISIELYLLVFYICSCIFICSTLRCDVFLPIWFIAIRDVV
jgi:hypothetical protein